MPEIFKKKNIVPSIYIFLIIFISVFFLLISPPSKIEVFNQSRNDISVGEIYGHTKIGQTFEVHHDDLSAIEVLLANFNRENEGTFIFHLRDDLKSEDDLVLYNGNMREVQDNAFFRFSFPKIENYKGEEILFSKGKKYYFCYDFGCFSDIYNLIFYCSAHLSRSIQKGCSSLRNKASNSCYK